MNWNGQHATEIDGLNSYTLVFFSGDETGDAQDHARSVDLNSGSGSFTAGSSSSAPSSPSSRNSERSTKRRKKKKRRRDRHRNNSIPPGTIKLKTNKSNKQIPWCPLSNRELPFLFSSSLKLWRKEGGSHLDENEKFPICLDVYITQFEQKRVWPITLGTLAWISLGRECCRDA